MARTLTEVRKDYTEKHGNAQKLLTKIDEQKHTAEDVVNLTNLNKELDGVYDELKGLQEVDSVRSNFGKHDTFMKEGVPPAPVGGDYSNQQRIPGVSPSILGYLKGGNTILDFDEKAIHQDGHGLLFQKQLNRMGEKDYATAWVKNLVKGRGGLTYTEEKVLQEGLDDQGGFFVPPQVLDRIISRKPTPTRLNEKVMNWDTMRDAITMPRVNIPTAPSDDPNIQIYTTGIRVVYTGEIPASSTVHRVTEPKFGQIRIPVYTAMMSMPITRDQIEDSIVSLLEWVADKFRETVMLEYDNRILNGTGIGQAMGMLNQIGTGVNQIPSIVTGSAAALTWGGLQDLAWKLPEQYEDNAEFIFSKTSTGLAISKLVDGESRPFWSVGSMDFGLEKQQIRNRPLMGYPTNFSAFMPDVAANAYPVLFGNLKSYYKVNRIGLSIEILRELYAETNQVLLLARLRFGGDIVEPWAMRAHKCSV